ncbi:MAG: lasso peptide biosynthesis B2 protein [Sciscionella sp.]
MEDWPGHRPSRSSYPSVAAERSWAACCRRWLNKTAPPPLLVSLGNAAEMTLGEGGTGSESKRYEYNRSRQFHKWCPTFHRGARSARPQQTGHAKPSVPFDASPFDASDCLEESSAVVLTLAASHQRVTWCHGVAADPILLHTWGETDSRPIAEPESTDRYTALRTILEPDKGDDHIRGGRSPGRVYRPAPGQTHD